MMAIVVSLNSYKKNYRNYSELVLVVSDVTEKDEKSYETDSCVIFIFKVKLILVNKSNSSIYSLLEKWNLTS